MGGLRKPMPRKILMSQRAAERERQGKVESKPQRRRGNIQWQTLSSSSSLPPKTCPRTGHTIRLLQCLKIDRVTKAVFCRALGNINSNSLKRFLRAGLSEL